MTELWRPVPGFEDRYEVSSLGRVRSLHASMGKRRSPKIKSMYMSVAGYVGVSLYRNDRTFPALVHRLVALAFVEGRTLERDCVNHIDACRDNNRADNLEWVTPRGNTQHALRLGRMARGERQGSSKLTEAGVAAIRASSESSAILAERHGVRRDTIWRIRAGKSWAHLPARRRA